MTPKPHILILGAGVTGLQTALSLLLTTRYTITIIARDLPPTPTSVYSPSSSSPSTPQQSAEYTSPYAGAIWRSHVPPSAASQGSEVATWDAITYRTWSALLASKHDDAILKAMHAGSNAVEAVLDVGKETGLAFREARLLWSTNTPESVPEGEGIWWRDVVRGFKVLSQTELGALDGKLKGGDLEGKDGGLVKPVFGARYDGILIDVPVYLQYLLREVKKLGGEIIQATLDVDSTQGTEVVVKQLYRLFRQKSQYSSSPLHATILAAGLASRHFLPPSEANLLFPIRGQTVIVKGIAHRATLHIFSSTNKSLEDETTYIIPRPSSNVTLIGGSKQVGDWSEEVDEGLTERILERARGLAPELLTGPGKGGSFEVLKVQVGFRPARRGGPRVEVLKERSEGGRVVVAYGHGGSGYENSVGSAEKVVRLVAGVEDGEVKGDLKARL